MRIALTILLAGLLFSCQKEQNEEETKLPANCNIQETYTLNESKVTITSGIWGTIAFMEGNCMPTLPLPPTPSNCKTCPVKRTIKIYEYTLQNQANPQTNNSFYNSFNTQLVKQIETDNDGFFQTVLAPGTYTFVVVENGKLYSFGQDGQTGISPLEYTGGLQKENRTLTYKAVF